MPRTAHHPVYRTRQPARPELQGYANNCVDWPRRYVHDLKEMIDAENCITRRTFLDKVDRSDVAYLEGHLGYSTSFPMSDDWHVTYHSGLLFGVRCYYFKHSAIEFVFTPKHIKEKLCRNTCETSQPIPWKARSASGGTLK